VGGGIGLLCGKIVKFKGKGMGRGINLNYLTTKESYAPSHIDQTYLITMESHTPSHALTLNLNYLTTKESYAPSPPW
jgi:hypothetical protein